MGDAVYLRRHYFSTLIAAFILGVLMPASVSWAEDTKPKIYPVHDFAALSEVAGFALSPDGQSFIYYSRDGGRLSLVIATFEGDEIREQSRHPVREDLDFHNAAWVTSERLIVHTGVELPKTGKKQLRKYDTRLYAMNRDGSAELNLDLPQSEKKLKKGRYDTTSFVNLLVNEPDHVLLGQRRIVKKGSTVERSFLVQVFRVNITTGERVPYDPAPAFTSLEMTGWYSDFDGNIRLGYGREANDKKKKEDEWIILVKKGASSAWEKLSDNDLFAEGKFSPLRFGRDPSEFYVFSSLATGRDGVFKFDLNSGSLDGKIFEHKNVDLSSVIYSYEAGKIVAVTHDDGARAITYFDESYKAFRQALAARIGRDEDLFVVSQTRNEQQFILLHAHERLDGEYYYYDRKSGFLAKIGSRLPQFDVASMASTKPVTYMARDGVEIPAFLTLPVTYKAAPLPAIVMPHGGPHARDYSTWHAWVQFLANRGYVVIQPNFRGSTGYGGRFEALGFGEWGQDMQQDIADAAKWLIRKGYADKNSICIVGASYGGYAALMGVIEDPEYFKCAVAWAPVTDIKMILKQDDAYDTDHAWYYRIAGFRKKRELRDISPLQRVKEFSKPVLLMHGDKDEIVDVAESRLLAAALKKKSKVFRYKEFAAVGHTPVKFRDRSLLLHEMEGFLKTHNPTSLMQ